MTHDSCPTVSGSFVISQVLGTAKVVLSYVMGPSKFPGQSASMVGLSTFRVALDGGVEVGNRKLQFPTEETSFRSLTIGDAIGIVNAKCDAEVGDYPAEIPAAKVRGTPIGEMIRVLCR